MLHRMNSILASLWTEYEQALLWQQDRSEIARLRAAIEDEIRSEQAPADDPCAELRAELQACRAMIDNAREALDDT